MENSQSLELERSEVANLKWWFDCGKKVFFQVRAIGVPLKIGRIYPGNSKPFQNPRFDITNDRPTTSGATIVGEVTGNGGSKELIQLSSPKVSVVYSVTGDLTSREVRPMTPLV